MYRTTTNHDDIDDTPHPMPIGDASLRFAFPGGGGSVDRYPLMQPWTDTPQKGDLNGDNQITLADAAIALRLAADGSASCDAATLAAADINHEGQVTSLDALMILQAAADAIEL